MLDQVGAVVRGPGQRQGLSQLGGEQHPHRDPRRDEPEVSSSQARRAEAFETATGMSRLHVVSVLVATVIAAACGSAGGIGTSANSYAGKTLKLGAILSITGQGSVYGLSSREGMELAVEQINKSGGVNGATIDLTVRDDASTQSQSAQIAQTMIQSDQDLALLGPTLSNSAVAVHPLAENQHIPILAVSTTGINIVPNCNFPSTRPCRYVFRDI